MTLFGRERHEGGGMTQQEIAASIAELQTNKRRAVYEDLISVLSNPDAFYKSSRDKLNDIKADIYANANKVKIERRKLQ